MIQYWNHPVIDFLNLPDIVFRTTNGIDPCALVITQFDYKIQNLEFECKTD